MTDAPVLTLRGIGKDYGRTVAVDAVDLELRRGEFVSFLGPSGSGKTTTLMMIAGLQTPSRGEMLLQGRDLGPVPPYRRNIGVVFQNYALFPHLSVAANVAFPLQMRRVGRTEMARRVGETLALVGLPDHGARLPAQLSGGQQQRVALARALVYQPPLLLMDEPLGALDKKLREQLQLEISRLHRELGITVLYVTHDQEEALVMSDRIAVFNDGRIEQIGRPQVLYEHPASRFVAGFVGESSFIVGRVTSVAANRVAIETAHGMLCGHPATSLAPGDAAVLAVRPERVGISEEAAGGDRNVVHARLVEVIYLGQSRKFMAALPNGEIITGLLPIALAADDLAPGQTVDLTWRASECTILPDH
jgi:putative spermidine/putrescine transport system ATP-binding protein